MKIPKLRKNVFDLGHERKLSCDMGKLIPILCEETIPGDHFKVATSMMVRVTPLLAPIMHRVNVFTHFFFVPNRLVWDDWEDFITGGQDGNDATAWPKISTNNIAEGSLADYFGIPVSGAWSSGSFTPGNFAGNVDFSALPFRAYSLIWNEWYRDNNIPQTELVVSTANGTDSTTNTTLQSRNWEKDYFTSALPWAQRGTAVSLPLGTTAPVERVSNAANAWRAYQTGTDTTTTGSQPVATDSNSDLYETVNNELFSLDPRGGLVANLSTATAASINELREAFQIQKWMERNARAGARYVESILAHFGVRSSDARLQRPEFLGGGRSPVVVSEVLQTSETNTTAQGTMVGHAYSAQNQHTFSKSFEEHGLIIGLMSIMPRTAYQQGLHRSWTRDNRYDYYWPEFANLGEQTVLSKEVFLDGNSGDADTFGYQGRYDEYRRRESTVHGEFRKDYNFWHMSRIFETRPTLSSTFLTCSPTKRMCADTTTNNCLVQVYNDVKAVRPMPLVAEPGFIDH